MTPAALPRQTPPAPSSAAAPTEVARAQRAGGPQDRALYACGCGSNFTAAVTTSVPCPRCGAHQPW